MGYRRRLAPLKLQAGEIAIDCGANVGVVTEHLAKAGTTVYAFEPNPHAFAVLSERFAGRQHVHCLRQAVLDREETLNLYFHVYASQDQVKWSVGSSLLPTKSNVNPEDSVEVQAIDLAKFILALNCPVRVLKIDVEGVECRILQRLIDSGAIHRIERVFVETHDTKIPELREETDALRTRLRRESLTHSDLDWI